MAECVMYVVFYALVASRGAWISWQGHYFASVLVVVRIIRKSNLRVVIAVRLKAKGVCAQSMFRVGPICAARLRRREIIAVPIRNLCTDHVQS